MQPNSGKNIFFSAMLIVSLLSAPAMSETRTLRVDHRCSTLDPLHAVHGHCIIFLGNILPSLVSFDGMPTSVDPNAIAYDWAYDEAKTQIDFYLNNNRRWSDGAPIVAEDFAMAWRRIASNPTVQSVSRRSVENIIGSDQCVEREITKQCLSGVKVITPHHLRVHLTAPDPNLLLSVFFGSLFAIPSHFLKIHGEKWLDQPHIPWAGGYVPTQTPDNWSDFLENQQLVLSKNKMYYRPDLQYFDKVVATRRKSWNPQSVREQILRGDMPDILLAVESFSPETLAFIVSQGWNAHPIDTHAVLQIAFHHDLVEPELRQALAYLINPDQFVDRSGVENLAPVNRLVDKKSDDSSASFSNKFRLGDINEELDEAKKLLAGLGISQSMPRTLKVSYSSLDHERSFNVIAGMLKQYGVKLEGTLITDYSSEEVKDYLENDVELEVFRFGGLPNDPLYFANIPSVSDVNILADDEKIWYQKKLQQYAESEPKNAIQVAREVEEFLINKARILPLAKSIFVAFVRPDICPINGQFRTTSRFTEFGECELN